MVPFLNEYAATAVTRHEAILSQTVCGMEGRGDEPYKTLGTCMFPAFFAILGVS